MDGVARSDKTGDILIWSLPNPTMRVGTRWFTGAEARRALPSADAMKDGWTIVSGKDAEALRSEAASALKL